MYLFIEVLLIFSYLLEFYCHLTGEECVAMCDSFNIHVHS